MHDALAGRGQVSYDAYTDEQRHQALELVKKYCAGEVEELEVGNLRQVKELFGQFKVLVKVGQTF